MASASRAEAPSAAITTRDRKETGRRSAPACASTPVIRPDASVTGPVTLTPVSNRAPAAVACRARMSSKSWRLRDSPKSG